MEEPVTQPATTAGTTSTPLQATGTGQQTGGEHPVRVNPLYVPHSPHPFATAPSTASPSWSLAEILTEMRRLLMYFICIPFFGE